MPAPAIEGNPFRGKYFREIHGSPETTNVNIYHGVTYGQGALAAAACCRVGLSFLLYGGCLTNPQKFQVRARRMHV
jgi:hypothetical protein